jgi:15-cis-phytoene synthase
MTAQEQTLTHPPRDLSAAPPDPLDTQWVVGDGTGAVDLSSAVAHCRELTRHHSKTFYFGSRFFPLQQRQAVWAVYAACRVGDDIADEPGGSSALLDLWWQDVQRALAGVQSGSPVQVALAWAAGQFPLPLAAFQELYLGLRMDLDEHDYASWQDLELYCRRVAGVIGFMIAPICGFSGGNHTLERALRLGQAMQLTNILRDVGEDLGRGRVYLPADLMARFGVTRSMLVTLQNGGEITPEYRQLMVHLTRQARAWYAEGRQGLASLHGSGRLAVAAAARAYEGILDALERNDYDNFSRRAQVSGTRKLMMLPQAWLELQLG